MKSFAPRCLLPATVAAALALSFSGCKGGQVEVPEVTVAEAVVALEQGAVFVDANTNDYREAHGKVPGAILLSHYLNYKVASTLPAQKDTPLVFYCSNRF